MYKIQVYVQHGYFEYEVERIEQAMAHGEAIMGKQVYRRSVGDNKVEFHHVYSVKVVGPALGTKYPDIFRRT